MGGKRWAKRHKKARVRKRQRKKMTEKRRRAEKEEILKLTCIKMYNYIKHGNDVDYYYN